MTDILASLNRLQYLQNILDVALVSAIIYTILRLFRGTQGVQLLRGVLVIGLIMAMISEAVQLTAVNWLLGRGAAVVLFAIPVIFQPELRRVLERLGRTTPFLMRRSDSTFTQSVINEVIKSVEYLAERKYGALIVLEGGTGLAEIIDRGNPIDSEVTSELLSTIFYPNTALHDGAVIINNSRIIAAGCVLPLTEQRLSDSQMGTRHRAAIGVTEQTDALSIVVSEETGSISAARHGRLLRLDPDQLRGYLSKYMSS